jgi:threonine dehydrogenase-like Zn-dependent dehydrogenase
MKSRSIRYVAKENVELVEIGVREPGHSEVLVKNLACGICAWDLHVFRAGPEGLTYPGHEGVGVVVQCGAGVTRVKQGDWVVGGQLGFSEYDVMPAAALYALPAGEKRAEDWIVEPVACVVNGLDQCALKAGDRVAVVGCGFMGLMFVQALSRSLVDGVVAIDVNEKRLELAKQFGATDVMRAGDGRNAKATAVSHRGLESLALDVEALQKRSIDTVIDCSGIQQGLELSSHIVRRGGRVVLFGWNHGVASFPGDLWHMNGLTIVNATPASATRDLWPPAIRLLARGQIDLRPLVTHVVQLEGYADLLRRICVGDEPDYIKGVVRVSES